MKRLAFLLCALLLSTSSVAGGHCAIKIQHDLRFSSQALELLDYGQPLYEIRAHGYLSIGGDAVNLNSAQRGLAEQYAGDLAALAARWIALAAEALELTSRSLELALGEALGADNPVVLNASNAVEQARAKFVQRSILGDGTYRLHVSDYNDLGETLEDELEDAGSKVTSALLAEIGKTLRSDELSFKEKVEAFGASMRRIGEEVGYAGKILEDTGEELCASMEEVRQLEQELQQEIPELADYSLFK